MATKTYRITATGEGSTNVVISASAGQHSAPVSASISVECDIPTADVYGVRFDADSSRMLSITGTRTDDASNFSNPTPAVNNGNGSSPFDNISPWKDIKLVDDANAGKLVEIPKFYYKLEQVDTYGLSIKIIDGDSSAYATVNNYYVSPAHSDRGDGVGERDKVYIGAYHCATSTYKSTSGVLPITDMYRNTARTNIHNLGSNIWQSDFMMRFTIWLLYLVEFANRDAQTCIGKNGGNTTSVENNGLCDSMTYHTGTSASSRTENGHTRYRYIEDLFGNVLEYLDGCRYAGSNYTSLYIIPNPSQFSDTNNGLSIGTVATSSGSTYPKYYKVVNSNYMPLFIPGELGGNTDGDTWRYGKPCIFGGGSFGDYQEWGLMMINAIEANNYTLYTGKLGARLMKLP